MNMPHSNLHLSDRLNSEFTVAIDPTEIAATTLTNAIGFDAS